MDDVKTLAARLRRFEDLEEIRDLKARYYEYADIWGKPGRVEDFANLFVADGWWDVGGGLFVGPKAIHDGLLEMSLQCGTAVHYGCNPRIKIDGDKASARWHGIVAVTPPGGGEIGWNLGIYDETYVRTSDGWRYKSVKMWHTVANVDGKGTGSQLDYQGRDERFGGLE